MSADRGSVSVLMLGVAGLRLALTIALGAVGALLVGSAEAQAAADAAALAAAPVTFLPFGAEGTATAEAARFAARNGAVLTSCNCRHDPSWSSRIVVVEVAVSKWIPPFGEITVMAAGRAEFVPAALLGR